MTNTVLVAASEDDWRSLVSLSLLPSALFGRCGENEHADNFAPAFLYAGHCAADPDSASVVELEKLDEMLYLQSNGHLVVLFRCAGEAAADLARFQRVSASWKRLFEQRKRRQVGTIRTACIIVGADSTQSSEQQFRGFLQHLIKRGRRDFFQDLYVMSPRLEPGDRDIFHSRNVWPVSAARLLLGLSSRPPTNDIGGIFAWRFREFRRTEPGVLYELLVPACSDALFDKLRASGQAAVLPRWSPPEGCLAIEEEKVAPAASWHLFPASSESDRSADPAVILERLRAAGTADSSKRAGGVIERWRLREELIRSFWASLHRDPGAAWPTQASLKAGGRVDIAVLGAAPDARLESLPSQVAVVKAAGENLKAGAAELDAAQSWFVWRWFRLAMALVAASLLGVLFFRGAQIHFGNHAMAALVASGCFFGAILAAKCFYALEAWRGGIAVAEWCKRKKLLEGALAALNENLVGLKTSGAELSSGTANVMLHSKVLRLVSRLADAVASVFQVSSESNPSAGGGDVGHRKTALRYLERSTARLGQGAPQAYGSERDLANHVVALLLQRTHCFQTLVRRWEEVCLQSDVSSKGAVDAVRLHEAFADAIIGLPGEVDRIVSEQARERSLWDELEESLESLKQRGPEFALLSVELSDTARLDPACELLVSRAYAEEVRRMEEAGARAMPSAAEAACPVLLLEFSKISADSELTPLGERGEDAAK